MKEKFGAEVELQGGGGGIFDVVVDDTLLFSKHEVGRFPSEGEVEKLIQESSAG